MLYDEFIKGTGCKDNAHNYKVYRDLEVMYMNSDMSKGDIYEYGKKLVDNSKSERELEVEAEVKAEIELVKREIENNKRSIEAHKGWMEAWEKENDMNMIQLEKGTIKYLRRENRRLKNRIETLKWVLA